MSYWLFSSSCFNSLHNCVTYMPCAFAESYICRMLCIAIADAFANSCTSYRAFLLPGHADMLTCAFAPSCP